MTKPKSSGSVELALVYGEKAAAVARSNSDAQLSVRHHLWQKMLKLKVRAKPVGVSRKIKEIRGFVRSSSIRQ